MPAIKNKKPKKKRSKEVGKDRVDRITQSPSYNFYDRPQVGTHYFIFRFVNDEITGTIIGSTIVNIRRNGSYPMRLENGEVIEFFGNKLLHGIIRDYDLVGCKVRIVYIGYNQNNYGRAAKVYRVFKIEGPYPDVPLAKRLKSGKKRSKKNDNGKT